MFCRLIWVYTVCQCPIQGALGTNGLGLVYCFAESDFFTTILSFEAEDTLYQSIIFSLRNLTCSALWENSTDDKLMIFFFFFFFFIFSPGNRIWHFMQIASYCTKCQILFPEKVKKNISNPSSAKMLPRVLRVRRLANMYFARPLFSRFRIIRGITSRHVHSHFSA